MYALHWVQEPFRLGGIRYEPSDPKSQIYVSFLPLLNSGNIKLLGNRRLINQLLGLERTTSRGVGRDIIDHPRGAHDDVINAAAGALVYATAKRPVMRMGTYNRSPNGNVRWKDPWRRSVFASSEYTEKEAIEMKERGEW